jgi:hypothetical protein
LDKDGISSRAVAEGGFCLLLGSHAELIVTSHFFVLDTGGVVRGLVWLELSVSVVRMVAQHVEWQCRSIIARKLAIVFAIHIFAVWLPALR